MRKREKDLNKLYEDSIFYSIKNSIKSNFIIPFAISLNATNDVIAMISAAPQLIGSFFQLFSSDLMKKVGNRKIVIGTAALIDALFFIPILLIPFVWRSNYLLLLFFLILQAIAVELLRPVYNSLVGDIVPQRKRGNIFSRVNKISGIVSFITSITAGLILSYFSNPFIGFAIIFSIAFVSRSISAYLRFNYSEPKHLVEKNRISLRKFTAKLNKTNFGKFVLYSSLMKFAVGISSPFFAVYMLSYLKLDFLTYSVVNAASIISSFLVLSKWGSKIDLKGSRYMLRMSGFLVPWMPVLWIFFKNPLVLIILQFISGATWSAYNLSSSNFMLDATTRRNRLVLTSYNNFFVGVMTFLGALLGGFLMRYLPADFYGNVFYFVFALSGVLRLLISGYFIPTIKEERRLTIHGPQAKRIDAVNPQQGLDYSYIPRKPKKK